MSIVKVPEYYEKWRLSQGFNEEMSTFLYDRIDSKNLDRLRVYLDSHYKDNRRNDLPIVSEMLQTVTKKIVDSAATSQEFSEFGFIVMALQPNLDLAFELSMYGYYDASLTLMRSSIEGMLRLVINGIKVKQPFFEKLLTKVSWPTKIGRNEVHWEDALNVEKRAASIFEMCIILDKIRITHPIKGSYEFLEIKPLNDLVHMNINSILESDASIYNQTERVFSKQKRDQAAECFFRYSELLLILIQNGRDCIDFELEPLLMPSKALGDIFPTYSKLIYDRLVYRL